MGMSTNIEDVQASFRKFQNNMLEDAKKTTRKVTDDIFDVTQTRVPVDTSALKNSGRVESKRNGSYRWSFSIWYGEPGEGEGVIDYAAAVHEILDAEHHPPTGAKYVEQPLLEGIPGAKKTFAGVMKKTVKRSFG